MQSQLSRYAMIARRWAWVLVLGVLLCGGGTYVISKLMRPVYQASAFLILSLGGTNTSPYDSTSASLAALPTYAQLLTNPTVLKPVVALDHGLTLNQLTAMISVKPQSNTQIIELDVQDRDPQLAMQLANEVSQSFAQYVNTQIPVPAGVQILPAQLPTTPFSPKPLSNAALGAVVGLGLALALIVIFEWIDDRPRSPEEVKEILGVDVATSIHKLSRNERSQSAERTPALAEAYRMLCARLTAAQAIKPFKGIMVTSALADEGKSTVATNLAIFLAMAGNRVLLVDADLRRPTLHRRFQLDKYRGLTSACLEWTQHELEIEDQPTIIPTLRVLPAGAVLCNPAELLQSSPAHQLFTYLQKTLEFDYVVFDTPPLLPVADAQILASYIQTTVLVIDVSSTPRKVLLRAWKVLSRNRTAVLGVVLNRSPWPDCAEIRHYLGGVRRPRRIDLSMPPAPPNTPPLGLNKRVGLSDVSSLVDGDDLSPTITFPRPRMDKSVKS